MLARIGITVKLNAQTKGKHFDKIGLKEDRNTSFFMLGWGANTVDAHNPLAIVLGTPTPDGNGQWNMGAYSNPKLDEFLSAERQAFDPAKRKKLLAQAMSLLTEEAPAQFMWRHQLLFGLAKNVDYRPLPSERIYGWNMKVR